MKKLISLLMAVAVLMSFAACGDQPESASVPETKAETQPAAQPAADVTEPQESSAVQIDEGLLNVEITLNASFFEDQTAEEIKAGAEANGYLDCKIGEDGSVTYTMSKKKHAEMLDQMKKSMEDVIAQCLEGEEKVASFVDIQYNDDFSEVNILVDAEKYSMFDSLYAMTFYFTGAFYQAFSGTANEDIDVIVNFIDQATEEVLDTASYQNFISQADNSDDT